MKIASKSPKREEIINKIIDSLTSDKITKVLRPNHPEKIYKAFMYPHLRDAIRDLYIQYRNYPKDKAEEHAKKSIIAEIDRSKTLHAFTFLGTKHRPDIILKFENTTIAIEIKVGDSGTSIREGIGQSIVYTTHYGFCIYVFIDSTRKDIVGGVEKKEKELIDELWENHNIRFIIV